MKSLVEFRSALFPAYESEAGEINSGRYAMDWKGFSTEWYGKALTNPLIVEALITSLTIAGTTAAVSAIIGTLAALGLQRVAGFWRNVFDGLTVEIERHLLQRHDRAHARLQADGSPSPVTPAHPTE